MRNYYSLLFMKFLLLIAVLGCASASSDGEAVWKWSCQTGRGCEKVAHDPRSGSPPLGLEPCQMFCNQDGFGLLFPRPTGTFNMSNFLAKINPELIHVALVNQGRSTDLMDAAVKRFKQQIPFRAPEGVTPRAVGKTLQINILIRQPDIREMSLDMDEGYALRLAPESKDQVVATISATNFFGARHAMETLAQLIVYDDIRNQIMVVRDVEIVDKPVYPYRGLLLDTARNYYSVQSIKRTIDGMAAVKLNTFHWHITDSQSFPFASKRRPGLSNYGAYSPRKIYTKEDIQDIVRYGLERGVRVLPEFDAPAHVGEGWQNTNLTVCFNAEPWQQYCVEPPCGQLNPTLDHLYDVLEDIYRDMAEWFQSDIFHMGGDEVSERCWNTSAQIQQFMLQQQWGLDKNSFLKLWDYFQVRAQKRVYDAFGKQLPLIMWTSSLTESKSIAEYLNKDDYIIQVWTTGSDPQIYKLLNKGYRLIMSNYDALYLDCGFGAWVGEGNNWCSPYIGWQKVYMNSPAKIAGEHKNLILGGEATLWSEQADTYTLDSRLWPRGAALAERLWAEPDTTWREAEARMLAQRERLVKMGIGAESIQPEWCYQNSGYCN